MKKTLLTLALSSCMSLGCFAAPVVMMANEPAAQAQNTASVVILTETVPKNRTFQMLVKKGSWNKDTHIDICRIPEKYSKNTYAYDFTTTPLKNGDLLVETNSWIKQTDGLIRVRVYDGRTKTYHNWVPISGVIDENDFYKSMDFPGKRGWEQDKTSGVWAWYHPGGRKESYWQTIDGKTYRFTGTLGNMVANQWFTEGGKSYFLGPSGALVKNKWADDHGDWYFTDGNGNPITGWKQDGNAWYYLKPVDSANVVDNMYYFDKTNADENGEWAYYRVHPGKMAAGEWMNQDGSTYYFGKNGAMKKGWAEVGGKWYYFYNNGNLARNTTIDGYKIDANGVWVR